jgi:site-specific DNA-cytosine methylase
VESSNKDKIILHLCASEFGSDSKPYRDAGYDVRLITKEIGVENYHPPKNIYGIIANPPCERFSMANPKSRNQRDFSVGMRLVRECLRIIWESQEQGAPLAFWVIENPRGYLERFLGKPAFKFQNWQFGEPGPLATKRTWLWGYFNVPSVSTKERTIGYIHDVSRHTKTFSLFPIDERNKAFMALGPDGRSEASPFFTKAFFEANR